MTAGLLGTKLWKHKLLGQENYDGVMKNRFSYADLDLLLLAGQDQTPRNTTDGIVRAFYESHRRAAQTQTTRSLLRKWGLGAT